MQFHSTFEVFPDAAGGERCATIVAEFGSEMVFSPALFAMVAHFSGRHSDEVTACAFDDLDIAYDKFVVYRH